MQTNTNFRRVPISSEQICSLKENASWTRNTSRVQLTESRQNKIKKKLGLCETMMQGWEVWPYINLMHIFSVYVSNSTRQHT